MEVRGVHEELHQVGQIGDGKKYILQSVFSGNMFAVLTRVWRSTGVFAELPKNAAAVARHYATLEEDST